MIHGLVNRINLVQVIRDCGRWDLGLCLQNEYFVKAICSTELIERSAVCESFT